MYPLRLTDVAKYVCKRLQGEGKLMVYFNAGRVAAVKETTRYWDKLAHKDVKLIGTYDGDVSEATILEDLIYYFESLLPGSEWLWTSDVPSKRPGTCTPHVERWCI